MTNIEMNAMHSIVYLPKAIEEMTKQLARIADTLAKMEAKDGPTIGQIVRDALNKENKDDPQEDRT